MGIPTWLTAIATLVIAAATVIYATVTVKLWRATLNTARRTEELAKQARDAFKFQFTATYMQLIKPLPDSKLGMMGKIFDEAQWIRDLHVMLSKLFPEVWGEMWETVEKYTQEHKT